MGDSLGLSIPRRQAFEVHEAALLLLAIGTALALLVSSRGLSSTLLEVAVATSVYSAVLFAPQLQNSRHRQKIRFCAAGAYTTWFYCAVWRIIPALGLSPRDRVLLAIDGVLFGQTPAVLCEQVATARVTGVLSVCYLTYHIYLALAVGHAIWGKSSGITQLATYLFTAFAFGFAGYLLVPAVGPIYAYPDLFREPLPGGSLSRLIAEVVAKGSSGFDTFPSLHVMITCVLLDHDWREVRWRFWMMVLPALGLMVSTIYLRYHYGVDVLAGLLVFLVLRQTFLSCRKRNLTLPE